MKVLIVSGIWPPDVGGPASHAPDVAEFLRGRGHEVEVVTTADATAAGAAVRSARSFRATDRVGVRHYRGAALVHHRAREADVVYTTGMFGRSALGATLARKPYVVKLTADPAFERCAAARPRRAATWTSSRRAGGGRSCACCASHATLELRHAAHVFTPSAYLARARARVGRCNRARVACLPNPTPVLPSELPARDELRRTARRSTERPWPSPAA